MNPASGEFAKQAREYIALRRYAHSDEIADFATSSQRGGRRDYRTRRPHHTTAKEQGMSASAQKQPLETG